MKNKIKSVGLNETTKDTGAGKLDKPSCINNPIEPIGVDISDSKDIKQKIEQERQNYGKISVLLVILTLGSLIGPVFPFSWLPSLMLVLSTKKIEKSNQILGQIVQDEASKRIGETLSTSLEQDLTKFYSTATDQRLKIDKNLLDYFLILREGISFAISIRAIVPAAHEKYKSRVILDTNRRLLAYRKGESSRRYFNYDPLKNIKEATEYLAQHYQDEFNTEPTLIVVMADPTIIKANRTPEFTEFIGERNYMRVDGVYVVEEERLVRLISAIFAKKLEQGHEKY